MDLTNITKMIGSRIASIKENNKLIEELNTIYNPTFLEIMEDLLKTNETLASMLILWYESKYSVNKEKFNLILDELKDNKEESIKKNKYKETFSTRYKNRYIGSIVDDSDCGGGGGCGSISNRSSGGGGCGSSYNTGGC